MTRGPSWGVGTAQRGHRAIRRRESPGLRSRTSSPRGQAAASANLLSHTAPITRRELRVVGVRAWVMALVVVLAVAGVAACSDSGGSPNTASTLGQSASGSASSSASPADQEVLGAYRSFWDASLAAADPMDPLSPK